MNDADGCGAVTGVDTVGRRGSPAIGDPGRAAREVAAGPPPPRPWAPDHVLSEHSTDHLEIRAASVRGLLHRHRAQPRQDAFSVAHDCESDTTVVVVADGVGSLPRSGEAAAFVVDRLPELFWVHRDWGAAVKAVNAALQEFVDRVLDGLDDDGRRANGMATTVVAAAIGPAQDGRHVQVVRSDDSTVWWLGPDGTWSAASAEQDDAAIHTGAVRALPTASPRLHHSDIAFEDGALFVMTDGVGTPLADSHEVQEALARWWSAPPTIFEFGGQVGFGRKTHIDDRTAVGVWLRPPEAGEGDVAR